MKIFYIPLFLLSFLSVSFAAEQQPEPVNENAFLIQKEISTWPTDKTYDSQVATYNCQAVRIHPNWFLTAAHCVYNACATRPCTVQILLAQTSQLRANIRVFHSTVSPSVYIYPGFFPGQNRISGMDAALIHFNPQKAEYSYIHLESGEPLSQAAFEKALLQDPEAKAQFEAAGARLLNVALAPTSKLKPQIIVPKTSSGVISYLFGDSETYFIEELQHFLSPGFGVRPGNSGGGVFTRSGDLAGMVSSILYEADGSASFQNADGKIIFTIPDAQSLFTFTGFNSGILNFIRNKVPGLRTISVIPGFATPSDKDFEGVIKAVSKASVHL